MEFSSDNVWDNKGFASLEKQANDSVFGFSFYGTRHDANRASIYNNGIGFQINKTTKKFEQEKGGLHFLGSPGGQMIQRGFFNVDKDYENAVLTETDSSFIIDYTFKDDKKNELTDIKKILEIDKISYLPIKISTSSIPDFGKKQSNTHIFSNIKTNNSVVKSINSYIVELNEFELIKPKKPKANPLLNQKLPTIILPNLFNENELVTVKTDKVTLIDFWEVWCGWCIKAFPDVEDLKTKYGNNINIIGVVTKDKENARKLVNKKGTTFVNLIGNKTLNETFNVTSWPRYFLVDTNGTIIKEYRGFSTQIDEDIKSLIK